MRTVRLLTIIALAAASVSAQADTLALADTGTGSYGIKVTSLKERRFQSTLRQQYDFSCGSAAVATLLTYHYDYPVTEQSVFGEMFARGDQAKIRREGFSLLDMKKFLQAHQFEADGFALPISKLFEAGLPAIVLIVDKGYHHFVVVKGLRDGRVLIGDPSSGTRAISQKTFESIWVNKILFVIHNKQTQATFNHSTDWRAAPRAPLAAGVGANSLAETALYQFRPGDF